MTGSSFSSRAIAPVVEALLGGGVAVVPTDTVYGIAARAADAVAVERLFELKGRAAAVPVAVLCGDPDDALALGDGVGDEVRVLAARHWPGPLTLVLRRRPGLGWALGAPEDTIGVRCPDHPLVRALAREVGPLATTSANRHGTPTPPTATAAAESLAGPVDAVVDGGRLDGIASTVVDTTQSPWRVLRQGGVDIDLPPHDPSTRA